MAELKEKPLNFHQAFTMMKNGKNVKRKDWGKGKYLFIEKNHIYMCDGKKMRNSTGDVVDLCELWENSQAELFAEDYIVID